METDDLVELDRTFALVQTGKEPDTEHDWLTLRHFSGNLKWSDLLQQRRVVLLAEQSSGKTSEFKLRHRQLLAEDKFAFRVTVDDLADGTLENCLDPDQLTLFSRWQDSTQEAWFFLDSVDEARVNRKSSQKALRHFAQSTAQRLHLLHVLVSCRPNDWQGQSDREIFIKLLPMPKPAVPLSKRERDELLQPVLAKESRAPRRPRWEEKLSETNELMVVKFWPLNDVQRQTLAVSRKVANPDQFITALNNNGLAPLADRPGDLLYLADYWKSQGRFSSYAQMMEQVIAHKLKEPDQYRPDNDALTPQDARIGVERIAAALTFGKSLTLRTSGAQMDHVSRPAALCSADIIPEWSEARQATLLRRGVFIQDSYERNRFQSRWIQEYLTAAWLQRRLSDSGSLAEVEDLLFTESDGIATVVPSLQPAAAWLALQQPMIRTAILARDPSVLLRYGDPGSLPLDIRRALLRRFAEQHANGELSEQHLDTREVWMFSDPALSDVIHEVWVTHPSQDLHFLLLHIIEAAGIAACMDLARTAALDVSVYDAMRIVAVDALLKCNESAALKTMAVQLVERAPQLTATLASECASRLFPSNLSLDQLLYVIEHSQPPRAGNVEGFSAHLPTLWRACATDEQRRRFLQRITELCLQPLFAAVHIEVSARYLHVANGLRAVAADAIRGGWTRWQKELIPALMVVERSDDDAPADSAGALKALVRANPPLNRALFWANIEQRRLQPRGVPEITHYRQANFYGEPLWEFSAQDLPWLMEDLSRPLHADRRIVLSAVADVLAEQGQLAAQANSLRQRIGDDAVLLADLNARLVPPEPSQEELAYRQRSEKSQQERSNQQEKISRFWIRFQEELRKSPTQLRIKSA